MLSDNATVGFRTRPSPRSMLAEALFTAPLENSRHIHILAESPSPLIVPSAAKTPPIQVAQESKQVFSVQMDATCTEIHSFGVRVDVADPTGQALLAAGSAVKLEETPTCEVCLSIDNYVERINFPLPVDVANTKLRIARKSKYTEVFAPLAMSMHIQNEHKIAKRFLAVLDGGIPASLNIHRVNLDCCPPFKLSKSPGSSTWLVPHVSLMFSRREGTLRQQASISEDTFVNLKNSLHFLLISAGGAQGPVRSVFALQNTSKQDILAFIIVADLRLDVGSHTVLADAWVVPGTTTIQDKLSTLDVGAVVAIKIDINESEAWRYLLPLLIERCRTWAHRPHCEYLKYGMIPLYPNAGADPEKSPFCSCGAGLGTETSTFPQELKSLASYATRAAISPLFAVPYLEKVGMILDEPAGQGKGKGGQCKACGKQGGSLSLCGKCKGARYCSRECQVKDWKAHKKYCVQ